MQDKVTVPDNIKLQIAAKSESNIVHSNRTICSYRVPIKCIYTLRGLNQRAN